MNCGHCPVELLEHDGLLHCPACGCYFAVTGGLDPNHTACRAAPLEYAEARSVSKGGEPGVEEAEEVPPEDSPTPERRTRRAK